MSEAHRSEASREQKRTYGRLRRRALRAAQPEKVKSDQQRWFLKRAYGLTIEQHEKLREVKACQICGGSGGKKGLFVDHCADTKSVRGLLCSNCNFAIGQLKHNPSLVREAAMYLESEPAFYVESLTFPEGR